MDLHCHSGPSPMPRHLTHVEAARMAAEAGMRAVVVKCHYHDTAFDVHAMEPALARIKTSVFGGVALNSPVGGVNPHAADLSLKMGGRIIWFPTISSAAHLDHASSNEGLRRHFQSRGVLASNEVDILGSDGELLPEVHTIIDLVKESGAALSTGHLAPDRALVLVEAAAAAGLDRLIVSHPNFVPKADPQQVVELTKLGATIEHEIGMYDNDRRFPLGDLLKWIDLVGPDHTSLASDLGQAGNPLPVDAYRRVLPRLLDSGIRERDLRTMTAVNPARLISLDD
ncbi:DUF6282 family protein [Amycolatopsis pigmentata]|uniref:DUF6282 family protein n=1 Tax=Amycolatopsis pigmentata TaxID=450801 RepID=A0ABW5G2M9_9PSEU